MTRAFCIVLTMSSALFACDSNNTSTPGTGAGGAGNAGGAFNKGGSTETGGTSGEPGGWADAGGASASEDAAVEDARRTDVDGSPVDGREVDGAPVAEGGLGMECQTAADCGAGRICLRYQACSTQNFPQRKCTDYAACIDNPCDGGSITGPPCAECAWAACSGRGSACVPNPDAGVIVCGQTG